MYWCSGKGDCIGIIAVWGFGATAPCKAGVLVLDGVIMEGRGLAMDTCWGEGAAVALEMGVGWCRKVFRCTQDPKSCNVCCCLALQQW